MKRIEGTPGGTGPLPDGSRADALRKVVEQRQALEKSPMPDAVKEIRDNYLKTFGQVPNRIASPFPRPKPGQKSQVWQKLKESSLGLERPGSPKPQEPRPLPVQPKYGLPMPIYDHEPRPLPVQPKYGLPMPIDDHEPRPLPAQPKYGLPMPIDGKEPRPLPGQPKYGLPMPREGHAPADRG